jgi:hydroxypyruvate isomerase
MIKFDLNISILLKEYPFLDRPAEAARNGFRSIEFWWPRDVNLKQLNVAISEAGVGVTLFNFDAGSLESGERGYLNDPSKEHIFRENVPRAIEFATKVNCKRINVLAGKWLEDEPPESQLSRVRENIEWAADLARSEGITLMIEALNQWENRDYIFTNTRSTVDFINSLKQSNIRYQYDIYHMQRMEGNIVANIREHIDAIGHIQIADSPGRNQPGTGELNFQNIFAAIEESGYTGFVGLEYNPKGTSVKSFDWLSADLRGTI